jgi:hypothetical protein
VKGFYDAYSRVSVVPLLAKKSYYETGFITPRPWEAILFGSIPVGLEGHFGIWEYVTHIARDPKDLLEYARHVRSISPIRRKVLREEAAHKLSQMDVRKFVDVLEALVVGTDSGTEREDNVEE